MHRNLFFALAALLVCCAPVHQVKAQIAPAVQAFDQGNELYRAGKYQEAIDAYNKAIDEGYTSGALYYNMGNAHYRMDRLGEAIRYYEKARLLTPENEELLHNIKIAQTKTIDQFSKLPVPVWVSWWQSMTARTGGRWLFWTGLLFYVLAIGIVIYRMRTYSKNPWLRRARAASILLGIVLLSGAFVASIQSIETRQAVILVERTDLHEAPDAESMAELAIHEGLVVDVLQQRNNWTEIRLPNGAKGWVPAEVTGEI